MSGALIVGSVLLAVLAAAFAVASFPGGSQGRIAQLGRGGLVALLPALGLAMIGVGVVLLPDAIVVGAALLAAGLLLLALAVLAALRGRPSDRPRRHAPSSDVASVGSDATHERDR